MNMNIEICNNSDTPIHKQVSDNIKAQILCGEIKAKEALPSVHLLARALHISVQTMKLAYEDLENENLIYTLDDEVSFVKDHTIEVVQNDEVHMINEKLKSAASLGRTYNVPLEKLQSTLSSFYNSTY